ncbi:hypothetical protein ACJRPK_08785 [Aquimarina sp. 2-A2]|uniref:Uncharacterized protein n=1 Tax=Aquimarina intermedia TaxID=350814 RepID=A0A5S5C6B9_9FLAO|nr:hypothetical protein [Aquimarina intermedia]TYP73523.1 hypothetical protein BD809_105110 [Aquimarina intermedia]
MLINTSHNDPEVKKKIISEVGAPFTLKERFKLKGVGSPKLYITQASIQIYNLLQLNNDLNTCNIELRPSGIILGFHIRLETYALVIPFYKLSIYKGTADEYSIYRDNYYVKIKASSHDKKTHSFIKKILNLKSDQRPTAIEDL